MAQGLPSSLDAAYEEAESTTFTIPKEVEDQLKKQAQETAQRNKASEQALELSPIPQDIGGASAGTGKVPYLSAFTQAAQKYNVPVNVLIGLAEQESRFKPTALGVQTEWGRAKGLMQYLDSTAAGMGINPYDPVQSIDAAARQLRQRLDKGYSMIDAAREHFAGPDRKKWGTKTHNYGIEVMQRAQKYQNIGAPAPSAQPAAQQQPKPSANPDPSRYRPLSADEIKRIEQAKKEGKSEIVLQVGMKPIKLGSNDDWDKRIAEQEAKKNIATDTGNLLMLGVGRLGESARELTHRIPITKPVAMLMDKIDEYFIGKTSEQIFAEANDHYTKKLSVPTAKARQKLWVVEPGDKLGDGTTSKGWNIGPAWKDPRAYYAGIVESVPELAVSMGGSLSLARGAFNTAIKSGATREAASKAAAKTATLAGSFIEGGLGGAHSAVEVRKKINELPDNVLQQSDVIKELMNGGMTLAQAKKEVAEKSATKAFVLAGVGTGVFGGLGDRTIAKIITEGSSSRIKSALSGAVAEGVFEEMPQSAAQQLAQNYAVQDADPNQRLMQGVANQAAGGLAVGAAMGGGIGAGTHRAPQTQQAEQGEQVQSPDAQPTAPVEQPQTEQAAPPERKIGAIERAVNDGQELDAAIAAEIEAVTGQDNIEQLINQPNATPIDEGTSTATAEQWLGAPGTEVQVSPKEDPSSVYTVRVEGYQNGEVFARDSDGTPIQFGQDDIVSASPVNVPESVTEGVKVESTEIPTLTDFGVAPAETKPATQADANLSSFEENTPQAAPDTQKAEPVEIESPEKTLAKMDEAELRARIKYLADQAKASGGWNKRLMEERRKVETQINKNKDQKIDDKPYFKWEGMSPAERMAAAEKAGIDADTARDISSRAWGAIDKSITDQLTAKPAPKPKAAKAPEVKQPEAKKPEADYSDAVPEQKQAATQEAAPFRQLIIDAHFNNPPMKAQLIQQEIKTGRPRHEVMKDVQGIVADIKAGKITAPASAPQATKIEGKDLGDGWSEFSKDSGTIGIPRADMPQIKAEHRGAMVNFMNARGINHKEDTVAADSLKPTQKEFSREKVKKASEREGGDRSILVSKDGHVLDGHHQWMAAREKGEDVKVIRLDAPIKDLVDAAHEFPSSTIDESQSKPETKVKDTQPEKTDRPALPERYNVGPFSGKTKPINKTLYREMDAEGLNDLVRVTLTNGGGDLTKVFVTDNIDLAIGQGKNKGILVQMRGDAVSGEEHYKPGTNDLTGREYQTDFIGMDAIDQIHIPQGTKLRVFTRQLIQARFDRQNLDDGSVLFTRKGVDIGQPLNEMRMDNAAQTAAKTEKAQTNPKTEKSKKSQSDSVPNPYNENELRARVRDLNKRESDISEFNKKVKQEFPNLFFRAQELAKTAKLTAAGRRGNTYFKSLEFNGDKTYVSGDPWPKRPSDDEILQQAIWHLSQKDENNPPAQTVAETKTEQPLGKTTAQIIFERNIKTFDKRWGHMTIDKLEAYISRIDGHIKEQNVVIRNEEQNGKRAVNKAKANKKSYLQEKDDLKRYINYRKKIEAEKQVADGIDISWESAADNQWIASNGMVIVNNSRIRNGKPYPIFTLYRSDNSFNQDKPYGDYDSLNEAKDAAKSLIVADTLSATTQQTNKAKLEVKSENDKELSIVKRTLRTRPDGRAESLQDVKLDTPRAQFIYGKALEQLGGKINNRSTGVRDPDPIISLNPKNASVIAYDKDGVLKSFALVGDTTFVPTAEVEIEQDATPSVGETETDAEKITWTKHPTRKIWNASNGMIITDESYVSNGTKNKNFFVYRNQEDRNNGVNFARGESVAEAKKLAQDNADIRFSRADQTKSEAFKKWFGDSKVVDANGNPQVRYHGTRDTWSQWDEERAGGLIHTTDDMSVAEHYSQGAGGGRKRSDPVYQDHDGNIFELDGGDYVNRKDGTRLTSRDIQEMIDYGEINSVYPDARVQAIYVRAENPLDLNTKTGLKVLAGIDPDTRFGQSVVDQAKNGQFDWNNTKHEFKNKHWANDLVPKLKALGYDAIAFSDDGHQTLSVFDSEQIKSETDNVGTFDASNPDIRFSRADLTDPKDAESGKPINAYFSRNTVSSKNYPQGMDFGQDLEPAGEYMNIATDDMSVINNPSWQYGLISFKNPLVLEHKSTDSTGWKKDLSEMYNGKTGKALSAAIKKAGYDAVVTKDKYGYSEVVNLTGEKYQFSKTDDQPKNLFVAHNLSASNILAANDLGGLAAPSIAVARSDVSDFSGYGEVTLLADPKLLEDSKIRTFDADIYSPRQPRAHYNLDKKKFNELMNELEQIGGDLRLPSLDDASSSDGAENFVRSDAMQLAYLTEINKAPKLKQAKVNPHIKSAAKLEGSRFSWPQDPKFAPIAKKYFESRIAEYSKPIDPSLPEDVKEVMQGINQKGMARAKTRYYNEDGSLKPYALDDLAKRADDYRKSGGYDYAQLRSDISEKMRNEKTRAAFEKWATDKFNSMVNGKTLFKGFSNAGNKNYLPYTLENVVAEMTQQLQAGEGTFYGAGSARSAYANEMKTIRDIQDRRDQIVTSEDMERIKEESSKVFEDAIQRLKPFYKYDTESWGYANDAGSAISEGAKGIREAFRQTPESKKIIADLTDYLRNLPTNYFEAKAQRAVQFSEFNTAIVPKGMDKQALQVLRDAGLKIKTYDPKDKADRARVIAQQEKLLFSQGDAGAGTGTTVAQVRESLVNRFDEKTIAKLERDGTLSIVDSFNIPNVEGFARGKQVTLVANALTPDAIIPTFLHELGGHVGFQGVMKPQAQKNLMDQFNKLVAAKDPIALEAKRLAERETDPNVQQDEYLPYLVTVAARTQNKRPGILNLIARIVSAVKAWAVDRLGMNISLNANDVLALAERMVRKTGTAPQPSIAMGKRINRDSDIPRPIYNFSPASLWTALSQDNDVFTKRISNKTEIAEITKDLNPEFNIENVPPRSREHDATWMLTTADGITAKIIQGSGEVWIDVSNLRRGGGGKDIYNIVANYAYNNDLVFISDPSGLSDQGMTRRLENMLSSSIKFGTTRHLKPHDKQVKGNKLIPAIDWKVGDDIHNIEQMMIANYNAMKFIYPEISGIKYNPQTDSFEGIASGRMKKSLSREASTKIKRDDFAHLASAARSKPRHLSAEYTPTAGATTLERAVLIKTYLEGTALDRLAIKDRFALQGTPRLTGDNSILFSRADNYTGMSTRELSDQITAEYDGLKLGLHGEKNIVTLSRIVIPEVARNAGTGTAIMQRIIDWADQNGKTIALTPSSDFGGNKKRLTEFYKRFDFVENKGRNKDFEISEAMYREAGSSSAPDIRFSRADNDLAPVSEQEYNSKLGQWWKEAKQLPSDALTNSMRGWGLGLVPLRPMLKEIAKDIPAAQTYLRVKDKMDALRNEWHAKVDAVAQDWLKYRIKNREENRELMDIMHESTLEQVDPSMPFQSLMTPKEVISLKNPSMNANLRAELTAKMDLDAKREEAYDKLKIRYDDLSPEARSIFEKVRDAYSDMADAFDETLLNNMEKAINVRIRKAEREYKREIERIKDEGMEGTERDNAVADAERTLKNAKTKIAWNRKARLTQLRQQFETQRLAGPYFPLARFGQLFVTVRDAKTGEIVSFSRFEKAQEQRRFADEMKQDKNHKVEVGALADAEATRKAVDPNFVADVEDILADLPNAEQIKDEVWQRYLESLPDMSIRKSRIHRKGRAGYISDAVRAFGHHLFHGSHQLARMTYSMDLEDALDQARDEARETKDPTRSALVVNEMNKRHQFVMNPTGGQLATWASSFAFVWYLAGSPKAALMNLFQTPIMGIPILAAYDGQKVNSIVRAGNQLSRALVDFTQGKGYAMRSTRLTAEELDAMEKGYETGIIEKTQGHELAGVAENGVEYNAMRERVMKVISWGFHHTERLNREVTFLAAYRIARNKGVPHEQAISDAGDLTWKTHFDYSNTSRPRLMHSDTMKILLVFRNFQLNMLFRLFRDVHQAMHGDSKEARREALTQLAGITGMMMLNAGITGTWLFGIAMLMAGLFLGDGEDPEEELKKGMVNILGPNLAGLALYGVPGHITGTALSESVGMPDLWFRSPDSEKEGEEALNYWMSQLLGAVPAIGFQIARGVDRIGKGEEYRGIETMLPKMLKDPMKSYRYATEGAKNMKGDTVAEVRWPDVVKQATGFTPARISEQYKINNLNYNKQQLILKSRKQLMDDYYKATQADDEKAVDEVISKIEKHNEKNPDQPITAKGLIQSAKTRQKGSETAVGGMRYNTKLRERILEDQAPSIYK